MKKQKSYVVLIIAALLLIASSVFALAAYRNSYQESVQIGKQLTEVKNTIKEIEAGNATGDLEALKASSSQLSTEKLAAERPYSYGLVGVFFSLFLLVKGILNAVVGKAPAKKADINRLAQAGLLAALSYIGFAYLKIDVPLGNTAFHFGNVFCVLAALLLGGYWGGLSGALGMTIGDLTTQYVTSAPKTFLLKFCIGAIVGFVAHKLFKLDQEHDAKRVSIATVVASICGMGFNIVADPLVGYFYKSYLLGVPQDLAKALAKIATLTTSVNAVLAVILASVFYLALRPALKKAGLFVSVNAPAEEKTAKAAPAGK